MVVVVVEEIMVATVVGDGEEWYSIADTVCGSNRSTDSSGRGRGSSMGKEWM